LFAILKALSAVRVAAEASAAGVDCVPVFWLATEDHDLAEINHALIPDPEGALHMLTTSSAAKPGAPVKDVRFGNEIEAVTEQAVALLGDTEASEWLREAYRPGETIGSAFGKLFTKMFAKFGVILLDASDPALHAVAAPIYRKALIGAAEIDEALLKRGKQLRDAGYHEQVKVTASSTLLFTLVDGVRTPIHRANGQFTVAEASVGMDELLARIDANPARFSPNVLLRPVVQDWLLPTLAYSGGPAEVAYFAQVGVVYEKLLRRVTPVLPRFSATLIDPRAQRLLGQYKLSFTDLFHGPDLLRRLLAERSLPDDLQQSLVDAENAVQQSLERVRSSLAKVDPTLLGAAQSAEKKITYQVQRLRSRAAAAELRKNEIISRHAQRLSDALFPNKDLQERQTAGIYFVARYGTSLLQDLAAAAASRCPDHQLLYL
jgi:bacillithiol biosynthesis cysteine-adding enzyme BshC